MALVFTFATQLQNPGVMSTCSCCGKRRAARLVGLNLMFCWFCGGVLSAGLPLPSIDKPLHPRYRPDTLPITISGRFLNEHDEEPLGYATVYALGAERGVQADADGYFRLTGLPPGEETFRFTHVGCEPQRRTYTLTADTAVTIYLHHHDNYTETVVVDAEQNAGYTETADARAAETLSEGLNRITGVSVLRTGPTAAKPIHDGLFGNRLSIQNNGISQSGQLWGNDHAPEIDPWIAAYVRVVSGVEAMRYAGSTLGATVLIEPAPLRREGELSGKAAYTFRSNGMGHILNARLTNPGRLAYRVSGTGKLIGDHRAPDYFLNNTGRREGNAALQAAYFIDDRWTARAYYSLFTANIGILRGSHIGNITDLLIAVDREEPFFTEEEFSYGLESPRQFVHHHLLKLETEFRPREGERFALRYGGQLNDREEFDVRRGGRSDQAALALEQWNHLLEGTYHRNLGTDRHLDAALQFEATDNDNVPGTGILPLIPNYSAVRGGAYVAYHDEGERFQYHAGLRYDWQYYDVTAISRSIPRVIERFDHVFPALGASLEGRSKINEAAWAYAGVTYRERAPGINELYSRGLHQGVSGIEEGDMDLEVERSLKTTLGVRVNAEKLSVNVQGYVQPVRNYIYLEPQPRPRVTIRGTFPLFLYRGADVFIYGFNAQAFWQIRRSLSLSAGLAVVRGDNLDINQSVVYLPGDNLRLTLDYSPQGRLEDWRLNVEALLVREQTALEPEQDFQPPPPGYGLVNARVARSWELPNERTWSFSLGVDNLLNTRYRDYLDRQRYFADGLGRNVNVRVGFAW